MKRMQRKCMEDIDSWEEKFEVCNYAKKFLDKITHLNNIVKTAPVDIIEIKKAIFYAKKYHGIQIRQSGEPYYAHPLEVAYMLAEYIAGEEQKRFRTDILVASILHDSIEDTELTKGKITKLFNQEVGQMVNMLSKNKEKNIREIVNTAFLTRNHDVLLIKLFDRVHNILTLKFTKKEKQQKKAIETIHIFLTLALYLKIENIKELIEEICCNILNSDINHYDYTFNDNYQLPFLNFQSSF